MTDHHFSDTYQIIYLERKTSTSDNHFSRGNPYYYIRFKNLNSKKTIVTEVVTTFANFKYNGWDELVNTYKILGDCIVWRFEKTMINHRLPQHHDDYELPFELYTNFNKQSINGDSVVYPKGHIVVDTQLNHVNNNMQKIKKEDAFFEWELEQDIRATQRIEEFDNGWRSQKLAELLMPPLQEVSHG